MLVRVEQARALVWDAARAADEAPETRALVAALAAGTALDAAHSCAKDCIQILGGIGFTWEHDAHLHLRRALVARQLLGAGDAHRLRAARLAEAGARRELSLELPAEAARHRAEARLTIAAARGLDPEAARRALAPTGYAAPHLPAAPPRSSSMSSPNACSACPGTRDRRSGPAHRRRAGPARSGQTSAHPGRP